MLINSEEFESCSIALLPSFKGFFPARVCGGDELSWSRQQFGLGSHEVTGFQVDPSGKLCEELFEGTGLT